MENRIGVPSLGIAREGNLPPHCGEGHSVKSYSEVGCWNECLQDGTMYLEVSVIVGVVVLMDWR